MQRTQSILDLDDEKELARIGEKLRDLLLIPVLKKAGQVWGRAVAGKPLPWYAEEKARAGAYAALVGLELRRDCGTWSALGCGDSCFFQLRSEAVIETITTAASCP